MIKIKKYPTTVENPVIVKRISQRFCSTFYITHFAKLPVQLLDKIKDISFVINTTDEPKDMKFVANNDDSTEEIFSELIQEAFMTKVEEK